ncbi:polysaccharide biosynthesis/export family protein [Sphingobacterium sp. SRCM116780]|uniref:polysaccharide biosynthesis/export family protein n=1 Tax=Sphingobacterium sp. SRCM116780 TaxID=2907623 RepID=UPI001F18F5D9|nr:polysaccharide biosynthesis/export family protein [Sphingobacterium sp. SRCM116780]UIR55992.1 polysaccharide biosynthesis/export family protein [Sphingobacterium sp. SRCM116780]
MNKIIVGFFLISIVLISSCKTTKTILVKDMEADVAYQVKDIKPLEIQKGDRLSISISSKNPELAIPFNEGIGSYQVNNQGAIESAGTNATSTIGRGYLVSQSGRIDFPILGELQVMGMTLEDMKSYIQNQLIDKKYISDPIVKVELLNLKINVMGEVASVGTLDVPDGQMNLLEALSKAGGITRNAAADKVVVIREENGQRKMIVNNIESKEIFDSPVYHLKQNDIVYVTPKAAQLDSKQDLTFRYVSLGMGFVSVLLSVFTLIK